MEYDYEKAVQVAQEFKKLLNEARSIVNICGDEINEADKAFGDIRHYCEINYTSDRKKQREVYLLIRKYSQQRRLAKNIKAIMEPLVAFAEAKKTAKGRLEFAINNMQKELNHTVGERKYAPRVLDGLFKEDEENGKVGS